MGQRMDTSADAIGHHFSRTSNTALHALAECSLKNTQHPGCTSCVARMVIRKMDSSLKALASSALVVTEVGTADAATATDRAASHQRQVAAAAQCKSRIPRHKADLCLPDPHQTRRSLVRTHGGAGWLARSAAGLTRFWIAKTFFLSCFR